VTAGQSAPRSGPFTAERRQREHDLFRELSGRSADDPRRSAVRDELVTMHLPLVRHLAHRYHHRGESVDDLVQVGTIGLIKAVDRFDTSRDVAFSSYAAPTILGEIKQHFRDRTWALRVPRRLQELGARVSASTGELTRALHRAPTVRELAAALDVSEEDVLDAIEAGHAYATDSIDAVADADRSAMASRTGFEDPAFERVDDRESLRPLLEQLPELGRRIIELRFLHNMSQTRIAEELGISQMQVSRLLARSLAELRAGMTAG
jgi:RNA polymerase sigma-B factor